MSNLYTRYHMHSFFSLLDSTTPFQRYVDLVAAEGGKAIAFTEHGNQWRWIAKKMYCDKKEIKYIHGMEAYLTQSDKFAKIRDNYHVVLLAKNLEGVEEINRLFSKSYDNFYFKPRISFEDFLNISDNVITTSACLGGPLWQIPNTIRSLEDKIQKEDALIVAYNAEYNKLIASKQTKKTEAKLQKLNETIQEKEAALKLLEENIQYLKDMYIPLLKKFDYLEVQHHVKSDEQKKANLMLWKYAKKYHKELIAGTDTHAVDDYGAECRILLMESKRKTGNVDFLSYEDEFDMTWKTYDELVAAYKAQGVLPEEVYMRAIENTNRMADRVEDFELDKSFKYNDIPGVDDTKQALKERINERFVQKRQAGIIPDNMVRIYLDRIREEFRVLDKIGMTGFILFMSNLMTFCRENNIPVSPCRGSVGGCLVAYIVDIIDLDPIKRKTVFSRFANEDRIELGDIDVDISPDQRQMVYDYIISSYPEKQTAYIISFGTIKALATIDSLCRAYDIPLDEAAELKSTFKENNEKLIKKFPEFFEEVKEQLGFGSDAEIEHIRAWGAKKDATDEEIRNVIAYHKQNTQAVRDKYPNIIRYYNGLFGVPVSQGIHPAGIIVAPSRVDLFRDYGVFMNDGKRVLSIDMDECHDVSLVKYDILGLKQMQILRLTCETAGIRVPLSHEMDWEDPIVWKHMMDSPIGIFQFEGRHNCSH